MAEKLEDLNLPNAVVTRIVKEALPDGVNVAKEARIALAKSASVFILYITSSANNAAASNNRKTINGPDVLQALANAEFYSFVEPLQDVLDNFRKMKKEKKEAYAKRKQQKEEKKLEQERNVQELSSDIDKENSMEEGDSEVIYECID